MKPQDNVNFIKRIDVSKCQLMKVLKRNVIVWCTITKTGMKYAFIGIKQQRRGKNG